MTATAIFLSDPSLSSRPMHNTTKSRSDMNLLFLSYLIILPKLTISAPLLNFSDVSNLLNEQNASIWVASFGGVGSEQLALYLEARGLTVNTSAWDKALCHFPYPVFTKLKRPFKAIYVYGDPVNAICSQKRRGFHGVNLQKLRNNDELQYSDEDMLRAMAFQFEAWTTFHDDSLPIFTFSYSQMFNACCQRLLLRFLGIDTVPDFPIFRKRLTSRSCFNLTRTTRHIARLLRERISTHHSNCQLCSAKSRADTVNEPHRIRRVL